MGFIKTDFNDFLNEAVSAGEKKVAAFVTKTAKEYGYSEADAVFFIKSTIEKLGLGVDESLEIYESMSDLDLIAKDSKNFKDFVKQAKKEYPQFTKGDNKDLEDWLQSIYDSAIEESLSEASAFMAKDVNKAVKLLNDETSGNPGYLFFGEDDDIEEFDKLWSKRKYQEALDMLAQDREIEAQSVEDIKLFIKESLNERTITIKRQYTDGNPAITVGHHAKIRNKVIEALKDGQITQEEFDTILKEMTSDSTRWMKRNSHYFNVSEDGITLSKTGSTVLKGILTEKTTKNPEIWVPGGFDKEISKYPNSKITKDIVYKAAKNWEVEENDAISYVEYAWSIDLKENNETMKHIQLFEQFINEKFSASDIKKLKQFAEKVADEIYDAYEKKFDSKKSNIDEDDYTAGRNVWLYN
jgi:CHASE3 domain sensor protein